MATYEQIFDKNRAWVEKMKGTDPDFFEKLAADQQPDYLYIGCSDSRVPANEIMGLEPGELFVHRNIANLVNNSDLNVMSVILYAVVHLKVKHIIVCGHYNCGGVKAAMEPKDMGLLNPWLRNIRDVYRLHSAELNAITNQKARYDRLVELNVLEQATNVIKTAAVQKCYVATGFPIVHGWVFDLHTGILKDLEINFVKILKDIQQIYDLTSTHSEFGESSSDGNNL
ncbi:MAG: carbonic anhydrase [Flavipsychrobacter sp.]|nr:carbonic anhydrase [Flavipsychrobacter sp.]